LPGLRERETRRPVLHDTHGPGTPGRRRGWCPLRAGPGAAPPPLASRSPLLCSWAWQRVRVAEAGGPRGARLAGRGGGPADGGRPRDPRRCSPHLAAGGGVEVWGGGGLPRRRGVVWRVVVQGGQQGGQARVAASTSAQQGLAPDCLQPPLVPRSGFRQQVKPGVGRPGRGEAKPRENSQDQQVLLRLGGRLSTRGSLTRRGTALRHRVRTPHSAESYPLRPGQAHRLPRPGRASAAGPAKPGAWVASPCRVRGWRSLACLARIRAAACAWAGPRGLTSHGPQQAGRVALGPERGWSAAGTPPAPAGREQACGACLAVRSGGVAGGHGNRGGVSPSAAPRRAGPARRGAPKAWGRGPAGGREARGAGGHGAPLCQNQRPTRVCS
jgi:hypothetical protein